MPAPHGIKEILQACGNPSLHGELSQAWYRENIVSITPPFTLRLAWALDTTVKSIRVHKLVADGVEACLIDIWNYVRAEVKQKYGYDESTAFYDNKTRAAIRQLRLDRYGGAFEYRKKRGARQLSVHSYGIALDFDPANNAMGTKGTLPAWWYNIWRKHGWKCGVDFRDPMHVQYCTGY